MRRAITGAVLGLALALLFSPAADAYMLWTNKYADAIGLLDPPGGTPNQTFIQLAPDSHPVGIAMDAGHLYWSNYEAPDSIGRAKLDGSDVKPNFITGARDPVGVAVDAGHVYWTNAATDTIGRANLDGSGVNQRFITGAQRPYGLAVDNAQIYWTNLRTGTIARANLDGSCPDQALVAGAKQPTSLAVDSAHLYWADREAQEIGRLNLDGSGAIPSFIPAPGNLPWGVAVDGAHVYWSNQQPNTIGRADLDGTNPDQSFTMGGNGVYGVAVPSAPAAGGHARGCPVPPAPPAPDRLAPRLSGLTLSWHAFAAAPRGASIAVRRSRVRVGTHLRYRLTEAATVRFTVRRRRAGRLVRGKCRRHRRAGKRCALTLRGSYSVAGARGLNRSRFRGRLRGRKIKPGRYYLVAVATDLAGNRSRAVRVAFRIRRR